MNLLLYIFLFLYLCLCFVCIAFVKCFSNGEHRSEKSNIQSKRRYLGLGFEIEGEDIESMNTQQMGSMSYDHSDDSPLGRQFKEITLKNCGLEATSNYIVGGEEAVRHEFPFIVSLLFDGKLSCGAAIINKWWIVTAAHCFIDRQHLKNAYTIVVGAHHYSVGQKYSISRLIIHSKFDADSMHSDIALIKVDREIAISSKVNGICLPTKPYEDSTGVLTVAGWGKTRFGDNQKSSLVLRKVDLPIISDKQCLNMYADQQIQVYNSFICTHTVGQDSCEGDSGGPAFQYIDGRAILIGIVSFGYECADSYPGVFTQVSWFLNWIVENVS